MLEIIAQIAVIQDAYNEWESLLETDSMAKSKELNVATKMAGRSVDKSRGKKIEDNESEKPVAPENKRLHSSSDRPKPWDKTIEDPFRKTRDKPSRLYPVKRIGAVVLLVGSLLSGIAYVYAPDDDSDIAGYEIINGQSYPITLHDSKSYRHDLELFGGKGAVMADDFSRWFSSQWKGKALARTLLLLSICTALVCYVFGRKQNSRGK